MKPALKLLTVVYFLWLGLELYFETIQWDYPLLYTIVKGGLIPLLIPFAWQLKDQDRKTFVTLIPAMILCWFGDLLLVRGEQPTFFIAGLGAFLLGQIGYAITFFRNNDDNFEVNLIRKLPLIPMLLVAIAVFILRALIPHLGDMLVPVVVYTLAITIMVLMAIGRYNKTNTLSFVLVLIGGLFFMLSDSLIAFNKFVEPITDARFWIMATYGLAQFLIVFGLYRSADTN